MAERFTIPVRPVHVADEIDRVRRVIFAAVAATWAPDGGSPEGLRAMLDVIDGKLCDLAETVLPSGGEP